MAARDGLLWVLRDAVLALLMGVTGIALIIGRRAMVGRGPFTTIGVVVFTASLCLLGSAFASFAVIARLAS
ncbi:MAG TPA: hypothetical protein VGR26_17405 [Acidimicrobiales bacterium]|nr:hypothetical protein [Acidimicrobiales bacterium]